MNHNLAVSFYYDFMPARLHLIEGFTGFLSDLPFAVYIFGEGHFEGFIVINDSNSPVRVATETDLALMIRLPHTLFISAARQD